jgi:alpha-amylase
MLGGGGNPAAWYEVRGKRSPHDGSGQEEAVEVVGFGNDWIGVSVEARPEPAADAWWSPIETVSNSESGFERVYQGSSLLLSWPARIEPGETRRVAVSQRVTVARDRADEERAPRA